MSNSSSIKMRIAAHLDACMALDGVLGCVIVSRTGALMAKRVEHGISVPSFAAMGATILGSAEAAAGLIHLSRPSSIFVEVDEGGIIVMGAGKNALITVIINKSADIESLKGEMAVIAGNIGEE